MLTGLVIASDPPIVIAWRPTLGPAVGRSETLLRSHGTPPLSFPLCLLFSVFSVYSKSTLSVSVSVSVVPTHPLRVPVR